jgi:hypothetical protein
VTDVIMTYMDIAAGLTLVAVALWALLSKRSLDADAMAGGLALASTVWILTRWI